MKAISGLNRILLVDDDEATNFIHTTMIKRACNVVEIQVVNNGRDALDYLTCRGKFTSLPAYPNPDIIFLDINMPGMDGWDFMAEYNQLPGNQQGKVLRAMLTTGLNAVDVRRANVLNMDFLNKPLTIKNLEEIICRCLNTTSEYFPLT
jgi:CheY-like chemotaxis protein